MRRSTLAPDTFTHKRLLKAFEGGAVYAAEYEGRPFLITNERAIADLLASDDQDTDSPVRVYEFDSHKARECYIAKRGWDSESNGAEGSAPSQGLLRIAGVSERDIDLLLLEEFTASVDFAQWFLKQIGDDSHAQYKPVGAQRSVTQSVGESDLLVALSSGSGHTKYLLIENKIAAGFQPRQAARYQERGRGYQDQGLCNWYSTVLVAPSAYLGDTANRRGFDAVLSYENLLSWFTEHGALGSRATYKTALLSSAISKAKYGYQPVEDAPVTDFWYAYWRLAVQVAPELEMQEPKSKPSRAGFIYFRPNVLPRGVAVVHKLRHGFLDLQFAGLGQQLSKLRAEFGDRLLPGMTIARAAKSGAIRQKVPAFDTGRDFVDQAENARRCLEQARHLLRWYLELKQPSPVRSNPGVQRPPASGRR